MLHGQGVIVSEIDSVRIRKTKAGLGEPRRRGERARAGVGQVPLMIVLSGLGCGWLMVGHDELGWLAGTDPTLIGHAF